MKLIQFDRIIHSPEPRLLIIDTRDRTQEDAPETVCKSHDGCQGDF